MTNQTDVVVDNIEEGISNEADAPTTTDAPAETTDNAVDNNNTKQTSSAEDEIPWWKQKRVLVIGITVLVIVLVVAIVLGVTLSSSNSNNNSNSSSNSNNYSCFNADDGGQYGVLYYAIRDYVSQDCASNPPLCEIGQTYGWPMNSWCVGSVKNMAGLFISMGTFNEDINGWNTSSVTDMSGMFYLAQAFNGDVSNFDTSSVTNMEGMFQDATAFNGNVSNFDTSSVTTMRSMFSYAKAFNQEVSNFDTSSVTDMVAMFYAATSFNMDLCSWQDSFPYTAYIGNIFTYSNCTYQDTPQASQGGPFCASDCQSSQVATTSSTLPAAATTTPPTMAPPTSVGGQSTPSASSPCFEPDDGGYYGVLYHAVRAYIDQDCANNKEREIAQTYGWPMNSWCVGNVKSMSYLFEYMDTFNEDINGWDTSSVTSMGYMFSGASSFNGDVSNFNFNTSSVTDMDRMFYGATSFNMDLCPWQDNFPYTNAADIFTNSGCTYQDTPNETQKGPFCASDCQSSQVPTTNTTLPTTSTTTSSTIELCKDTPNYLDMYNGGCDLYALPGNKAWCGAYGNDGEVGMTPNENCCVCK